MHMNVLEIPMMDTIRNDLRNPKCEGFFLESDGNEITVRRINDWQFDVTTESWRGNVNTYYKMQSHQILDLVYGWLQIDDHCSYFAHYPEVKWSDSKIERFMTTLCPKMCDPFFRGFTLSAEDAETYVVEKHPNGMEWRVDGEITDFGGVLKKTRKKLAENYMWKFEVI
jgi:hypothetical protein